MGLRLTEVAVSACVVLVLLVSTGCGGGPFEDLTDAERAFVAADAGELGSGSDCDEIDHGPILELLSSGRLWWATVESIEFVDPDEPTSSTDRSVGVAIELGQGLRGAVPNRTAVVQGHQPDVARVVDLVDDRELFVGVDEDLLILLVAVDPDGSRVAFVGGCLAGWATRPFARSASAAKAPSARDHLVSLIRSG